MTQRSRLRIAGKALRSLHRKNSGLAALHSVPAWSSKNGLTLGQFATEDNSNEITSIRKLVHLLSQIGCTVTIDAMGCQKEIATEI